MIQLRTAALTDVGRVRRRNEDRFVNNATLGLYGVADGVGGLPGGAEAAELVLKYIGESLNRDNYDGDLTSVVIKANTAVYDLGRQLSPRTGIGSTLSIGCVERNNLRIAHVGDSRCYLFRGGELSALTTDHSVENEIRARRALGEDIAFHEVNRNALTRCIGQPPPLKVDMIVHPIQTRDRYLFCTDGVTGLVNDQELAEFLGREEEPEELLRQIITLAIRRGGPDNATGVILYVDSVI